MQCFGKLELQHAAVGVAGHKAPLREPSRDDALFVVCNQWWQRFLAASRSAEFQPLVCAGVVGRCWLAGIRVLRVYTRHLFIVYNMCR